MEEDLLGRAADLAERCERTATVTSTAFLTPAGGVFPAVLPRGRGL